MPPPTTTTDDLVFPDPAKILSELKARGMKTPGTNVPNNNDTPLPIRYVEGKDWYALLFNILSFVLVGLVMNSLFNKLGFSEGLKTITLWIIILIAFVFAFEHLYTNVEALKAKIYLDQLSPKRLIVLTQGFHFTTWTSVEQKENEVDLQKHETEVDKDSKMAKFTFPSSDGWRMVAEVTIMFKRRAGEEAMSKSLKYKKEEIGTLIRATISQALSELGGLNPYERLLKRKADVTVWLANLFGGSDMISSLETDTGTSILDPVLNDFDLTLEDQKVRQARARTEVITDIVNKLRIATDASPEKATAEELLATARLLAGENSKEQINTHRYHGIPPGVTTFAPGDGGIAVGVKGGK